ncbi:MAG: hypothetical protein KKC39_00375 [Candidatus Omnitrophica bacterium]|nr:hypothetical protein [Candidatus Omnitrophota bacterium]MBU4467187.1 hypothetical protein [Candidatus Omnitrophota bacterium]
MFKLKFIIAGVVIFIASFYMFKSQIENHLLKKVIERLTADSRVAEVIVTDVKRDAKTKKSYTTIKFIEYDTRLNPLEPKYFTFSGNIIQFQSMVIRFDDFYVKKGHPLKGKSAYFFMKVFMLTKDGAETFGINKINEIPSGYEVAGVGSNFQKKLWQKFWKYTLDSKEANKIGIKNVQIEAPGTKFIPGVVYTIKIEHDGGLRIDTKPVTSIKTH